MSSLLNRYHAAALMLALSVPATADTLTGKVVHIADGDTITVLEDRTQYKVRLAGIDAPEKTQPFGEASRKHLASLVAGRVVTVEWKKHDKYGRIVGKVLLDGHDVCLMQLQAGFAWHFKRYQGEQTGRRSRSLCSHRNERENETVRIVGRNCHAALGVAAITEARN